MNFEELTEENAVLRSQIDNADVNLEQCRLNYVPHIKELVEALGPMILGAITDAQVERARAVYVKQRQVHGLTE